VKRGIYKAMASESSIYYTSEDSIHDSTFSEWIEKWWSWWLGIPYNMHIVQNSKDGSDFIYRDDKCSINQKGPVWFLPDVLLPKGQHEYSLEYSCEVPAGKDILIPITTTECDVGSEGGTDEELKKCANNFYDIDDPKNPTRITIEIDGNPIDPKNLKGQTGFFDVTIPENPPNIFGDIKYKNQREETYRAMASGYFLFLKPLTAGKNYTITFECEDHFLEFTELPISTRNGIFNIIINN
jgi:hypothetical protein